MDLYLNLVIQLKIHIKSLENTLGLKFEPCWGLALKLQVHTPLCCYATDPSGTRRVHHVNHEVHITR